MKIRTKTFLIILSVSIVLTCCMSVAHFIYNLYQQENYIVFANNTVNSFVKWDNNVSNNVLTPFTEQYINLQTKNIAYFVNKKFIENNKSYEKLAKDKELIEFLNKSIYLNNVQIGDIGIINDKTKTVLFSSDSTSIGESINYWLDRNPELKKIAIEARRKHFASGYYTYYSPETNISDYEFVSAYIIPKTNLIIAYALSLNAYMEPFTKAMKIEREKKHKEIIARIQEITYEEIYETGIFSILIFIVIYLLSLPLSLWFSNSITAPIVKLRNKVKTLGKGNLSVKLETKASSEIKDLINSFNYLGEELKTYTNNLTEEVRHRERVDTELNIARNIQKSTLPNVIPDFASNKFQLAANLVPAEKVAGDFYDFFYIENKLILIIADVSGKGISAALFMVMTKSLIANLCQTHSDPAEILKLANMKLSKNNKSFMFTTIFLSIYDPETGEFTYSNAGHENILLVNSDNSITEIGEQDSPALGISIDATYRTDTTKIDIDSILLYYTDGLTDARSIEHEYIGLEKIKSIIKKYRDLTSTELCNIIMKEVEDFENNELIDDITLLILKRTN